MAEATPAVPEGWVMIRAADYRSILGAALAEYDDRVVDLCRRLMDATEGSWLRRGGGS